MAHFAKLDGDNRVTQVIVVNNAVLLDDAGQESEDRGITFLRMMYGHANWRQTSYNATQRKNYAGVGYTYDITRDAFIPPQPYGSWTLDEATCQWLSPAPYPQDGQTYRWDEPTLSWQPT